MIGGKIYFVKRDHNLPSSAREWVTSQIGQNSLLKFVNQKLAETKVKNLILAKFFFYSEDDGKAAGFLVFDFVPMCTLQQLIDARVW